MGFADELRSNYNPPEERYYFKEIKYIMRTILESAKKKSATSHSLSGYYCYSCGEFEGEGIYETGSRADYYHIEDFGEYREGILKYHLYQEEQLITVANVKRALAEIRERLIKEGFKNVIVEERLAGQSSLPYAEEKMTFLERKKEQRRTFMHFERGTKKWVFVKMPTYALYISISW